MAEVLKISPDWAGEPCLVAAPGPSLTPEIAHRCRMARFRGWRVIAVQDSYRLMPWADAVYGCDDRWWNLHKDCGGFRGERWSSHDANGNNKTAAAKAYGLKLVEGKQGDEFSLDPAFIRYGSNSGFQSINLALLKGCKYIVLVGFDMRVVNKRAHFFGDHPAPLHNRSDFNSFVPRFKRAAGLLPKDVRIVNATPDSALDAFPKLTLEDALAADLRGADGSVHRDRAEPDAGAGEYCAA